MWDKTCSQRRRDTVPTLYFINFDTRKLKLYRFCLHTFKLGHIFTLITQDYFKNEEGVNLIK